MTLKLIRSPKEATADAALIEEARNHCYDHWDRVVLEAFEAGKKCYPRTFEYGLAAGNYATDLVSDGKILYRTQRVPGREYGQHLVAIAVREEVAP